jgi:hypothetical protein
LAKAGAMKKIVDINFFEDQKLEKFLRTSGSNFAVITSISSTEALGRDDPKKVLNTLNILCKYPKQIIFLRHSKEVLFLNPTLKKIQSRMIDEAGTKAFLKFAKKFGYYQKHPEAMQSIIEQQQISAKAFREKALKEADKVNAAIGTLSGVFSSNELIAIRRGDSLTGPIVEKIIDGIFQFARSFYGLRQDGKELPDYEGIKTTYQFRCATCFFLLALRRISEGHSALTKTDKILNDMIDTSYAAFATYFDGLLTNDKKLEELYRQANFFVNHVFL